MVENIRIAIINVQLKNTGQTRIKKGECNYIAKEVTVWFDDTEYITPIEVIIPDTGRVGIFGTQIELEPNEVLSEDVALALNKITFFAVRVEFRAVGATEGWGALAIFNADEKTKGSSIINLSIDQKARSG